MTRPGRSDRTIRIVEAEVKSVQTGGAVFVR